MFTRAVVLPIVSASLFASQAHAAYLTDEIIILPMNRDEVRTSLALDPSRVYRVTIESRTTLLPLLDSKCLPPIYVERCAPSLLFNGSRVKAGTESLTHRESSYVHRLTPDAYYIPKLTFFLWGTGRPLTLKTVSDFSSLILAATARVIDFTFAQEQEEREPLVNIPAFALSTAVAGILLIAFGSFGIGRLCARRRPDPEPPQRTPRSPFILPQLEAPAPTQAPEKRPESPPCSGTVTAHRPEPPAVRVPQYPRPPEPSSPLSRFFDPYSRIEAHHDRERFTATIEAETCLHKMDVEQATIEKKIQQDAVTKNFEHQARVWLAVRKFENQAVGEVAKHQKFRELVDALAAETLDPTQRAFLLEKLTALYLSTTMTEEAP